MDEEGQAGDDGRERPAIHQVTYKDETTLGRAGILFGKVATPALVSYTEYGTPTYLTHDLFSAMRDQHGPAFGLLHVDLASCVVLAETTSGQGTGLEQLACLPEGLFTCMGPRDMATGTAGSCGAKAIALDTVAGRKNLSLPDFIKLIKSMKPAMACAMTDEVPSSASRTRHSKAHNKTLQLLDDLIKARANEGDAWCPLLGSVVGGTHEDLRRRSAHELVLRKGHLDGYYIAGLGLGETVAAREEILKAVMSELPEVGPRLVAGLHTPLEIIQAVELGVDLVSSPLPWTLVRTGRALIFPISMAEDDQKRRTVIKDSTEQPRGRKRRRLQVGDDGGDEAAGSTAVESEGHDEHGDEEEEEGGVINLWDDKWKRDARPLVEGCSCQACSGSHSRAYVHHLLLAHEILGEELLHIHNLHHYLTFFGELRRSLSDGRLQEYKRHLERVCGSTSEHPPPTEVS